MKFSTKPVFIGWITLLNQLPLQLFFTFWCGGFLGGITTSMGIFPIHSKLPFILFGSAAFIGIPLVIYIGKKFNYERTEYRFYDDRLEFEEGFFTVNKKTIKFKDIREITLSRGIFQRV
jgi:uncharacterized membrane protein YdbT with pleckstrin-like domain